MLFYVQVFSASAQCVFKLIFFGSIGSYFKCFRDAILDVLFDEAFLGAHQVMPGTWFSAYRIPATSLINISHGYRAARKRNVEKKSEARILPKATPGINSESGGFGSSNAKDAAVDSAYASDN